jgi:hypothetical protein
MKVRFIPLRRVLLFPVIAAILCAETPPSLFDRICRLMKIDPKVVRKSRGGQEAVSGERLMVADLKARKISTLWNCGGCISPAVVDSRRIALIKGDAIWIVRRDGTPPFRALDAPGIRTLVGRIVDSPDRLLVLIDAASSANPSLSPRVADLSAKRLISPPAGIEGSFEAGEASELFPHPDEYRNQTQIKTSVSRPWHLQLVPLADANGLNRDLLPWLPASTEGVTERFSGIWLDDETVAYLESQ